MPHHHADHLYRDLPPAHVKQVLQAGPKEIDDEYVVQAFLTEVVYLRDTGRHVVQSQGDKTDTFSTTTRW